MRTRACVLTLLLLVAACGGGDDDDDTADATSSTTSSSTTTAPAAAEGAGARTSEVFEPAFTVTVPDGWKIAERGDDVAQLYEDCPTCAHGGEERGEVTLDMALADTPPDEAIQRLAAAVNVTAGEVDEVTVGGADALHVSLERSGEGTVRFEESGYGSDPVGEPIEAYVLAVGDRTVTVFVDPHESRGDDAAAFYELAAGVLETLTFTA